MSAWETVALGDVATIERRGVTPADLPGHTFYVGLEHIARGGEIIGSNTVEGAKLTSTKFQFNENHVLFGKLRPNLGKVAKPAQCGICSTDILPIKPGKRLDRSYLLHYLRQPSMIAHAASRASGANLPRVSPATLESFALPLPSLDAQRRIASILDEADAVCTKRRAQLTHLDELPQALFHEMFSATLDAAESTPLGEVAPAIDNGTSAVCETRPAQDDEWGILKLGAVTYGNFRHAENKAFLGDIAGMARNEVRPGDVLMTRKNTRELVGAVAIADSSAPPRRLLPDLIFRLHLDTDRIDARYFQAFMMKESTRHRVRDLASGSAASMPNISKARLRSLMLPLPPLADQQRFAEKVANVYTQHDRIARALEADYELFAALQHRAFRGEL